MKRNVLFYSLWLVFVATSTITLLGVVGKMTIQQENLRWLLGAVIIESAGVLFAIAKAGDLLAEDSDKSKSDIAVLKDELGVKKKELREASERIEKLRGANVEIVRLNAIIEQLRSDQGNDGKPIAPNRAEAILRYGLSIEEPIAMAIDRRAIFERISRERLAAAHDFYVETTWPSLNELGNELSEYNRLVDANYRHETEQSKNELLKRAHQILKVIADIRKSVADKRNVPYFEENKMRLAVACNAGIPGCFVPPPKGDHNRAFRLAVINKGLEPVAGCTAFLTKIAKDTITLWEGNKVQLTFCPNEEKDTFSKAIRNNLWEFLDVLFVHEDGTIKIATQSQIWPFTPLEQIFYEKGAYLLTVLVTGDGVATNRAELRFNWTGDYKTSSMTLSSLLVAG